MPKRHLSPDINWSQGPASTTKGSRQDTGITTTGLNIRYLSKDSQFWWDANGIHSQKMTRHAARFGFWRERKRKVSLSIWRLFVQMSCFRPLSTLFIDQWDWEKSLIPNGRHGLSPTSRETAEEKIYKAIRLTELAVEAQHDIESVLPKQNYLRSHKKNWWNAIQVLKRAWKCHCQKIRSRFNDRVGGETCRWQTTMDVHRNYDDWTTESRKWLYKGAWMVISSSGMTFKFSLLKAVFNGDRVVKDTLRQRLRSRGRDRLN